MKLNRVSVDRVSDGRAAMISIPGGPLTATVASELAATAGSLVEDRTVRVAVVLAEGANFCTEPADDLDVLALRPDPATALATLRVPVVVAVDGQCRGEGLEVALAGDIIIGTPASTYALDHVTRATVPAWGGSQRLPRAIGTGPATAMTLLGTELTAEQARSSGLLHSIEDPLDKAVAELIETLVSRGPLALELTKEAVHRGSELPLRDGLRLEGDLNHQLAASEDRAEGLAAFFEKRPPDFSGR